MIKCCAVLITLLVAVGCGGGTSAVPTPSPARTATLNGRLTGDLTLSGDVTGKLTLTADSGCYMEAPPNPAHRFALDFRGTVAGKTWTLDVNGAASGPTPSVVDAGLGLITDPATTYLSHTGDGTLSSVTVTQDMHTGSLSLQLKPEPGSKPKGQVKVTGTFSCSFP